MLQQIGFSGCDSVVSFLDQSTMSFLYPSFASALRIQDNFSNDYKGLDNSWVDTEGLKKVGLFFLPVNNHYLE